MKAENINYYKAECEDCKDLSFPIFLAADFISKIRNAKTHPKCYN